jgi:hypothetical protein
MTRENWIAPNGTVIGAARHASQGTSRTEQFLSASEL